MRWLPAYLAGLILWRANRANDNILGQSGMSAV